MPKYRVPMLRDCSQSTWIEVEADSPEKAEEKAYLEARNNWNLEWEDSDDVSKPYCMDIDEIEEIT